MNKFKSYLSGRNRLISKSGLPPRIFLGTCLLVFASPLFTAAAPVTFSASGADAASIQASVDAFRNAVGNPNNANNPGPLPGGRREINWDGGGVTTTISPTPFAGFQANDCHHAHGIERNIYANRERRAAGTSALCARRYPPGATVRLGPVANGRRRVSGS